jgi:hypothetical protein
VKVGGIVKVEGEKAVHISLPYFSFHLPKYHRPGQPFLPSKAYWAAVIRGTRLPPSSLPAPQCGLKANTGSAFTPFTSLSLSLLLCPVLIMMVA